MEKQIIPLFKSNFSIGKSILTLDNPSSDIYPNGPKSIFSILKENNINKLTLVEDNFYSFYSAYKYCQSNSIDLFYGINFYFKEVVSEEDKSEPCKFICFIKNKQGYIDLIKLNSVHSKNGFLTKQEVEDNMTDNLLMAMPFYDSFIYMNNMTFGKFSDFFLKYNPVFFIENNNLPFDSLVRKAVLDIAKDKYQIIESKTICYFKKSDVKAFLTYKCICNRSFSKRSLSKPDFEHFSSDEFCWEGYQQC